MRISDWSSDVCSSDLILPGGPCVAGRQDCAAAGCVAVRSGYGWRGLPASVSASVAAARTIVVGATDAGPGGCEDQAGTGNEGTRHAAARRRAQERPDRKRVV